MEYALSFLKCFFLFLYFLRLENSAPMLILIISTERSGVVYAVKLYPAGATTNSQDGVTDLFGKCLPVLEEMAQQNMPLLVFLLPQKLELFSLSAYTEVLVRQF